jgi:hypothetical protein
MFVDLLPSVDNTEQRHVETPEEDRNNWENLIESSERNNRQWFTEDVEADDRNWGVWLENQQDDNDWIMGF